MRWRWLSPSILTLPFHGQETIETRLLTGIVVRFDRQKTIADFRYQFGGGFGDTAQRNEDSRA
jgi:hypothetical protein